MEPQSSLLGRACEHVLHEGQKEEGALAMELMSYATPSKGPVAQSRGRPFNGSPVKRSLTGLSNGNGNGR